MMKNKEKETRRSNSRGKRGCIHWLGVAPIVIFGCDG